jgi:IclR family transcriptional regulator, acetate operon repressor
MTAPDASDGRYKVKSLGRALDLLDRIAEGAEAGVRLTDLAGDLEMSKAAAHAILQTLLARGLVSDSGTGHSRRYKLGMALAALGDRAVKGHGLLDAALPELRELTAVTGLTSRVAILEDGFAVVIGRVDGPGAVRFDAALGRRELPHCSAVGKALLATLPKERVSEMLAGLRLEQRTPHTITSRTALLKELVAVRRLGYAVDDEEDTEGIACIGACVRDRTGTVVGAISATGLRGRNWGDGKPQLAKIVMDYAARITSRLGGTPEAGA